MVCAALREFTVGGDNWQSTTSLTRWAGIINTKQSRYTHARARTHTHTYAPTYAHTHTNTHTLIVKFILKFI